MNHFDPNTGTPAHRFAQQNPMQNMQALKLQAAICSDSSNGERQDKYRPATPFQFIPTKHLIPVQNQ
jgi:hypothetical protein